MTTELRATVIGDSPLFSNVRVDENFPYFDGGWGYWGAERAGADYDSFSDNFITGRWTGTDFEFAVSPYPVTWSGAGAGHSLGREWICFSDPNTTLPIKRRFGKIGASGTITFGDPIPLDDFEVMFVDLQGPEPRAYRVTPIPDTSSRLVKVYDASLAGLSYVREFVVDQTGPFEDAFAPGLSLIGVRIGDDFGTAILNLETGTYSDPLPAGSLGFAYSPFFQADGETYRISPAGDSWTLVPQPIAPPVGPLSGAEFAGLAFNAPEADVEPFFAQYVSSQVDGDLLTAQIEYYWIDRDVSIIFEYTVDQTVGEYTQTVVGGLVTDPAAGSLAVGLALLYFTTPRFQEDGSAVGLSGFRALRYAPVTEIYSALQATRRRFT